MSGPLPDSRLPARFRVGEFEVFPDSHELAGPAGVQRIRPLIMAVLLRLAAEPGQVVTRERLLADVWPRRMVNDEVLSRAIAELRTALGDDARQARYIETLPKAGYRLVAAVEPVGAALATVEVPIAARKVAPAVPGRTHPAFVGIAVLAFLAVLAAGFAALRLDPEPGAELAGILAAAQPLTSDLSLELSPRFSPDGARAAFVVADGDESRIAIVPMGFCYPGVDARGGDRPPRKECAPAWHPRFLKLLPKIEFTLLVGLYAQAHYLGDRRKVTLTDTVRAFKDYGPNFMPLPHPSWRNTGWLRKNPWFEAELLPVLRRRVTKLIAD